ncbi:single-stranded DNA-binding protein [Rickettsiales bacterium]|nr:single-stranded DNA-binding protein [Rickettsiales bacterium]
MTNKYVNKVTLQGNLGSDPIVRTSKKGDKFITFSIATQIEYKKKDTDQKVKFVEWHNVVVYDAFLSLLARGNFKKGDLIYIEGSLHNSSWEDKDGKTHQKTQIVVRNSQIHQIKKITSNYQE